VTLRNAGITMPVLVLNPVTNRYTSLFANRLEPAVFSVEELDRLIAEAAKAGVDHYPVHIKLDTGMHRVGFVEEQLPELIERLSRPDACHVDVVSVFSHLATADCLDMDRYTLSQMDSYDNMCSILRQGLGHDFRRHLLNSAGMLRYGMAPDRHYDMARLGIGLYGLIPYESPESSRLKTVAALRTTVISLKRLPAGSPVGYGCRGHVERESIIATLPIGYADGVNRRFGCGAASFMVRGVECPTVGNICMDLCMIDVTDVPGVSLGDSVEIFGPSMPVQRLSDLLGTIPYEIFTSVSARVRRTYFRH
ncbi:MAG: alanine racemase, partial [Muribaculaceae bacterium]|nr:alanine racemase [Muribaculaceae bacterium]